MTINLLSLPQYRVSRIEQTDQDIHVYAEVANPPEGCIHCQSPSIIRWSSREQVLKDLPMQGRRVGIHIGTQRYRCQSCGKTFMEPLPGMATGHAMTARLASWLCEQSMERTFTALADETGVVEGTVRNLFRRHVDELEALAHIETPAWLGLGEIYLTKPRCVVSNIQNNAIVELLPNCDRSTVERFLQHLDGKNHIQHVTMNIWQPYRDAVQTVLPGARISIDKACIVRMADEGVEMARKRLCEKMSPAQRRGLANAGSVLLKRQQEFSEQERLLLDGWAKKYPILSEAYLFKEAFYGIYDADSPDEAQEKYFQWERSLTPEIAGVFSGIVGVWRNWTWQILAYFEHPVASAYSDSLKSLSLRVMNRTGRGYSFDALRAKILFPDGLYKQI